MMLGARTAAWSGKRLPYDAEVEWIRGDGSSYIETGMSLYDGDIECQFSFAALNGRGAFGYTIYGEWKGQSATGLAVGCSCFTYSDGIFIRYGRSRNLKVKNFDTDKHIFKTVDKLIFFDGESTGKTASVSRMGEDVVDTIALFLEDSTGLRRSGFNTCTIYKFSCGNNVLIPVRFTNERGETEGAFYDKVSGQLFRNQGTGEFVIGPDKTA